MLGIKQERWLHSELQASRARWNILANQVQMSAVDRAAGPEELYGMDSWAGYDAARRRLVAALRDTKVSNPVVITGDIHSNWVGDLKIDPRDEHAAVIGTELTGTSISTGGDGNDIPAEVAAYVAEKLSDQVL